MVKFRIKLLIAVLFIAITASGCNEIKVADDIRDGEYVVRSVIDGDTIELVNNYKVRYIGIDSPETMKFRNRGWEVVNEPYGQEAKKYNSEHISPGEKVRLEFDIVKKDKYDRWLAYVYVDNIMINEELLKQGYASVYTFPPNIRYIDSFMKVQEEAMRKQSGLWSKLDVISPADAIRYVGKIIAVRGNISDIHISRDKIFLDFEKELTAVIYMNNLPVFSKMGINPLRYYDGKYVEVVGKIEDKHNLQILIDNPTQIKVLAVGE